MMCTALPFRNVNFESYPWLFELFDSQMHHHRAEQDLPVFMGIFTPSLRVSLRAIFIGGARDVVPLTLPDPRRPSL
jgi:hypothetical protein